MCVHVINHPTEKIITEGGKSVFDSNYTKLLELTYPQMVLCGPAYTLERMLDYIHSLERKKKKMTWLLIILILHG